MRIRPKVILKRIIVLYCAVILCFYKPYASSLFTASSFPYTPLLGAKNNTFAEMLYQWFGFGIWPLLMLTFLNFSLKRAFAISTLLQWGLISVFKSLAWKGILPYFIFQLFFLNLLPIYATLPIIFVSLLAFMLPDILPYLKQKHNDFEQTNFEKEVFQIETPPKAKPQAAPVAPKQADTQGHNFQLPPLELLEKKYSKSSSVSENTAHQTAYDLKRVLEEFGIKGEMGKIFPGPVVTLYEFVPAAGIKTSRVISLADDIARSMSAISARIAVVPGQNVIGIEIPNKKRNPVYLRDSLESVEFNTSLGELNLALGQDIAGSPIVVDLAKMPHLLIAGTTGSGKSVGINTMILSLLFKKSPEECRFVMIDPKMLELSVYDGIPHLLSPVVTDPKKAVSVLKWAVKEMETRYMAMSKLGVRNIDGYNKRIQDAKRSGEVLQHRIQTGFDKESGKPIYESKIIEYKNLPYIVIVVDEMADLMMVAGKEIEICVQRLAQMARAAGLHLIMATQRPSVDVITGTIKANFPTRISFHVTSKIDSRTILGEQGAEQLLGQGDMLYMAGGGKITRIHGPFASDAEVSSVVTHLKKQAPVDHETAIDFEDEVDSGFASDDEEGENDPVYKKAVELIMQEGRVSTSFLQRKLQIGYNRAARIVDQMEERGVVSGPDHTGKRQILVA